MKHNEYFGGKVQSLGLNEKEGYATLGVIEPGSYAFSTDKEERMTVVSGSMRIKLPGRDWMLQGEGSSFVVPPKVSFDMEAESDVGYICRYR